MEERFIAEFEKNVKNTINKYSLISENDKVLVACSGGKDSITTLYLLNKFGYNVEGLIIDLAIGEWSETNLENSKKICREQGIKLHIVDIKEEFGQSMCYIRSLIQSKANVRNCTICGVIKRHILNKKARELNATKIATGHNLDDEAETVLMNLVLGSLKAGIGMGPKIGISEDNKFIQRIKPLYFCLKKDVRKYSELMKFSVLYEPCPCSKGSFRRILRDHISYLEEKNPNMKHDIVNNFLKTLPILREMYGKGKMKYCKICSEPSRNKICKTCELFNILDNNTIN